MADKKPKRLAYCDECKSPVGLAVGRLVEAARHDGPDGKVHHGKLVEIDDNECMGSAEAPQQFLDRMVKKYVK